MSRIFISHSSKNNDWASYVQEWLVANGWPKDDIFLDLDPERGIAAGQRWKDALQKAAHRCEAVLVVMTPQWLASDWCRAELNAAQLMGKRIFVLLVGIDAGSVPGDLRDEQWVDLVKEPELGWARLKEGLKRSGLDPATFPFPEGRPPYPGFAPLIEEDAAIFFGRDAQIVAGLDKLRGIARKGVERMLFILGASGSGKSSFLRAGLIPRLKRDDRNWLVLPVVRPERAAITGTLGLAASLAAALADEKLRAGLAGKDVPRARADIASFVTTEENGLGRIFAALREAGRAPSLGGEAVPLPTLVMPIDQGEELFNDEGKAEAGPFIAMLARALEADKQAIAIVSMRSDSFPQVQRDPKLAALAKETFTLDMMLEGSYRTIIEGPAALVRPKPLRIDPALTQALLEDVSGQDALPLLAFTLAHLYESYRADNALTLEGYEKLGRIKGVITNTVGKALAEGVRLGKLPASPADQLALVRKAFIPHLARVNSAGQFVRRVAVRTEIPEAARPVVDQFAADEARLLIKDRRLVGADEADVIEVAHEAVLREWKDLNDGLKLEREFLVGKSQLEEDVAEYEAAAADMKTGALMTGNKLIRTRDWLLSRPDQLTEHERRFIEASVRREDNRRRRWAIAAVAALALMTAAAAGFAVQARKMAQLARDAETERDKAETAKEEADRERDSALAARTEADRQRTRAEEQKRAAKQAEVNAKAARNKVLKYVEKIVAEATLKQADRLGAVEKRISAEDLQIVTEFEVENKRSYDQRLSWPTWPGVSSGVTIGIGYDIGYNTEADLVRDWEPYLLQEDLSRLKQAIGVTGSAARALAADFSDISIPFAAAEAVFKVATVPKFLDAVDRALPQASSLPSKCGAALLSLVYNRGASLQGERRREMKSIHDHLASGELERVPAEYRSMKRLWTVEGLRQRRDREADLFEVCLTSMDSVAGDLMRGFDALRNEAPDKAEQEFAKALQRDASVQPRIERVRAGANLERGKKWLEEENDEQAKAAFELALKADPSIREQVDQLWANAHVERGARLLAENESAKATEEFKLALAVDPSRNKAVASAYVEHASSLLESDKPDDAKSQFAVALGYSANAKAEIAAAYAEHGRGSLDEGDETAAAASFSAAVEYSPEVSTRIAEIYVERGVADAGTGRSDLARGRFDTALAYDAGARTTFAARLMPRIGELLKQGDIDQARPVWNLAARYDTSAGEKLEALLARLPKSEGPTAVNWPLDDARSPDYRHLDSSLSASEFELQAADLELLISSNHFAPVALGDKVLVGLRGALLSGGSAEIEQTRIKIRDIRPDHKTFRSVLAVFDRKRGTISAFPASTVPTGQALYTGWQRAQSGQHPGCNMLPTGSYRYSIGLHRSGRPIPGVFVQRLPSGDLMTVAALRSRNDPVIDVGDDWDVTQPGDNIHPSFKSATAEFSSFGSLTVPGTYTEGRHTGDWAKLRVAAGLPESGSGPEGARIDLVLLTGLEAAIAASLRDKGVAADQAIVREKLERLRQGSRGPLVATLRSKLGLSEGDEMDAKTVKALADLQRSKLGFADGILSPETDAKLGLCVFKAASCTSSAP